MTQNSRREIPQFNTPIVETHCHLDYLDSQALSETLDDAFRVGIERIVTISVSADNLDQVRDLANGHPSIWCTQGIHPHEAESWCPALASGSRPALKMGASWPLAKSVSITTTTTLTRHTKNSI